MGDDARRRVRPRLRLALAGIGGATVAVGVIIAAAGDSGSRGTLIVVSAVLLFAAFAARVFLRTPEIGAAAVGIATVAIIVLAVAITVGDDGDGSAATGLLLAALFLAAWLLPGFRGRNLFLALGLLSLIAAVGRLAGGGGDVLGSGSASADVSSVIGDQGAVFLLGAALCLGLTWWLDRQGYAGTGTATAVAGLVAAAIGSVLLAQKFGDTGGPALVTVVGVLVCVVGSHGARRATTWWGAALASAGLLAFLATAIEPTSATAVGGVAVLGGVILIVAPLVITAVRRTPPAREDGPGAVSDGSDAPR